MKTHLPVALRKALLAALITVTYVHYSPAAAIEQASGNIEVVEMNNNTADKTLHTDAGDIKIQKVSNVKVGDVEKGIDGLELKACSKGEEGKGSIEIGTSNAAITNATMVAAGKITFGGEAGAAEEVEIRGLDNDMRTVSIKSQGGIVFNQSVEIHPGEGAHPSGNVEISTGGGIQFLGEKAQIQNGATGNTATTTVTAAGPITFRNLKGTGVGSGVKISTTTAGSDITILTEGEAQMNNFAGALASAGEVSISGSTNRIMEVSGKTTQVCAADGIQVTATKENSIQNAEIKSAQGFITLKVNTEDGNNQIYSSSLTVEGRGNVNIAGGSAYLRGAAVKTAEDEVNISGNTVFIRKDLYTNQLSTLDAAGNINVTGGTVSVADNTSIDSTAGNVEITATGADIVDAAAGVTPALSVTGGNVTGTAGEVRLAAAAGTARVRDVEVSGKQVDIIGRTVDVSGKTVTGKEAVLIAGTEGTRVDSVQVKGGEITVGANGSTVINNDSTLNASGNIAVKGASVEITYAAIDSDTGNVSITGKTEAVLEDALVQGASAVQVISDGATTVEDTIVSGETTEVIGTETKIDCSDVSADESVTITGATTGLVSDSTVSGADVNLNGGVITVQKGSSVKATGGNISVDAGSLTVGTSGEKDTLTAQQDVSIMVTDGTTIQEAAQVKAGVGNVTIDGGRTAENTIAGENTLVHSDQGSVSLSGESNIVTGGAVVKAGGDVIVAGANNEITGETTRLTAADDITVAGGSVIQHAELTATGDDGDILITTDEGDKETRIEDARITGGDTVTVAGDTSDRSPENLAVITGEDVLIRSESRNNGSGITLSNASVADTGPGAGNIIAANGGSIDIRNRVDVQNGTLTIADGRNSAGLIVVNDDDVLNMKDSASLEGRLAGTGDINKSGGDALLLDYDHTGFNGSIYANGAVGGAAGSVVDAGNAGTWIHVTGAGVGAGASIALRQTDLVISAADTRIGTLDTTQDAGQNVAATAGTLREDGSYTDDHNTRAGFTTVGSVLDVNAERNGDVVKAWDMKLSDATLIKLNAGVDAAGQAASDRIEAGGTINVAAATGLNSPTAATAPSTARVFVYNLASAAHAPEGARTTIMTGTMLTDINEDVLYDVAKSANGTYQRTLLDRNVHLENGGDHVDLVFSKNYRSAAKDEHMQKVADVIRRYSDAFHHSEGTLAAGSSRMEKLVDAFDYTRSEEAARRGLQSLLGTGNVLPQLMLFDSSRHHLNALRRQMDMPVCPRTWKGATNRKSNTWLTYTGAHDSLKGNALLDDYSRSAHGVLMGVDTSVNCRLRVGLSLGYEDSTGESGAITVDADTVFADFYAAGYVGQVRHRASIGVASSSFESRRPVTVEAGYHSFHGAGKAETDALTLNFGYEISSDYRLNARSWLTRYAALNLAWHRLDDMCEDGLDGVGLATEYDKEWQAGVALGLVYNREFAAVRYEAPAVFHAHAAVHFELLADKASANNRFVGADTSWKLDSMDREPLYFEFGAGVTVPLSPVWTATGGAAVELGSERTSFSGNIGVRYSF